MAEVVRFESILEEVGSRGKFQMLVGTAIILVGLFTALQNVLVIAVLFTPNHRCQLPARLSAENASSEFEGVFVDRIKHNFVPTTSSTAGGQRSRCHFDLPVRNSSRIRVSGSVRSASTSTVERGTPENNDQSRRQPQEVVSCDSWVYETKEFQSTLVTRWNLVCGSKSKASIAKSSNMMGLLLGSLSWGFFSDRYGRRNCALVGIGIFVVAGIVASFPIHYLVFVVLRVIIGFGCAGASSSLYVLLAEAVDVEMRGVIQIAYLSIFPFALMLLSPLAFYLNDWSTLSLTISSCSTVLLATYWLVPESARWYIIKGRFEDAFATLQHVANVNGRPIQKDLVMQMIADCNRTEMRSVEVLDQKACLPILRDLFGKELQQKTLLFFMLWGVAASIYHAMAMNSPTLGRSVFSMMFLSGAAEVPAYILGIFLIRYLPRRMTIVGCFILSGLLGMSALLIPNDSEWISVEWIAFTCKLLILISWNLLYIFTMEVFPTRHRHLALGTSSTCARFGGHFVTYAVTLFGFSSSVLLAIYGGQAIMAGFACLWLPETKRKALPETIADTTNYNSLEMHSSKESVHQTS